MGLTALLIGVVVLIFIFVFSYLSNSPAISPTKSQEVTTQAKDAVSSQEQKNKIEQEQIKNIDLR